MICQHVPDNGQHVCFMIVRLDDPCADTLLGLQDDPEWTAEKELCMRRGIPYVPPKQKENIDDEDHMSAEAGALSVGERCEVDPGGKRGVIR